MPTDQRTFHDILSEVTLYVLYIWSSYFALESLPEQQDRIFDCNSRLKVKNNLLAVGFIETILSNHLITVLHFQAIKKFDSSAFAYFSYLNLASLSNMSQTRLNNCSKSADLLHNRNTPAHM